MTEQTKESFILKPYRKILENVFKTESYSKLMGANLLPGFVSYMAENYDDIVEKVEKETGRGFPSLRKEDKIRLRLCGLLLEPTKICATYILSSGVAKLLW